MKHVFTVLIVSGVLCGLTSLVYPQTTTTFTIYSSSSGSDELTTSLPMSNGSHYINESVKFVTAEAYLDVSEGTTSGWYLTIYTSTPSSPSFNPYDESGLFRAVPPYQMLIWKYRNAALYGQTSMTVGETITDIEWAGLSPIIEAKYKYLYNVSTGGGAADIYSLALSWASVVYDGDGYTNVPGTRIQLLFGIDLSSATYAGTYSATLNFEVYYTP